MLLSSLHLSYTPGPKGWSPCWYNISTNVNATGQKLVLGGEMSLWTDTYCYIQQCGAAGGGPEYGAPLFPPEQDAVRMGVDVMPSLRSLSSLSA